MLFSAGSAFQNEISKVRSLGFEYRKLNSTNRPKRCIHVLIYPEDKKYLRFSMYDRHYQFRSMPFGLATPPKVFTKLREAIRAYTRSQQIYMYLGDRLLKNADRMTLLQQLQRILFLLMDLELVINQSKPILQPTQQIWKRRF
jgi:hypothetical protein